MAGFPLTSTLSRCFRKRTWLSVGVASPEPGGLRLLLLKEAVMSMVGEGRAERGVSMLEGRVTGESLGRSSLELGAGSTDTQTNILQYTAVAVDTQTYILLFTQLCIHTQ